MRLFVALPLPDDAHRRLAALQSGVPGARWVDAANLHLTIRFLGEADRHAAEDLNLELAGIRAPAFGVQLSGVGFFDRGRYAHTLWAGVEKSEPLFFLRDKIESAAVRAGFAPEGRKFTPHVTLARLKDVPTERLGPYIETRHGFAAGPYAVTHFTLFESRQGGDGPHYEPLADYPLAGVT
ncbi:MAG: RNA 2',3'-cyclic phosphodiesterase [Alphaproteobacteria bacterium]|nr:RNA 2',3'-cyclic phosphodiesterase [Alphaproteobacteria bacterium]